MACRSILNVHDKNGWIVYRRFCIGSKLWDVMPLLVIYCVSYGCHGRRYLVGHPANRLNEKFSIHFTRVNCRIYKIVTALGPTGVPVKFKNFCCLPLLSSSRESRALHHIDSFLLLLFLSNVLFFVQLFTMSFATSVLRQQKAARVVTPRGVAFMQKTKNDSNASASFWTTTPVQQAAPEKKAPKETVKTMDIVKSIATEHHLSQAESRRIMNTLFDTIIDVSWMELNNQRFHLLY